jgi:hypothetical protein
MGWRTYNCPDIRMTRNVGYLVMTVSIAPGCWHLMCQHFFRHNVKLVLAAIHSPLRTTTLIINRFARINTPIFYMRQNVALFLDKWFFIQ